ncbi:unnamed protein product [Clavelina lepadiformis]|uniref:Protein Flattop n=1 Tax=Clavelina lepadiformis TaxID=159417 RepID=A0ABP0GWN7_CLALP
MSSHFSANQYEDAYNPTKLKNWTVPRKFKDHPSTLEGFSQIIATDRGHLKPDVPRSKESPWGTFMGTWDMPRQIPPARPSYTARSNTAAHNLKIFKEVSPLNDAVNGYRKFLLKKSKKTSPIQRPKTPSPPASTRTVEKVLKPTAGAARTPSPRKSASPTVCSQNGSPRPASKPLSPTQELAISPVPSVKSELLPQTPDSGRPRTPESIARSIEVM